MLYNHFKDLLEAKKKQFGEANMKKKVEDLRSIYLSIYQSIYLFIYIYLSIYLSMYLSIYLFFINLSISLSIFFSYCRFDDAKKNVNILVSIYLSIFFLIAVLIMQKSMQSFWLERILKGCRDEY